MNKINRPPPHAPTNRDSVKPIRLNKQGLPEHYLFRDEWEVTPREVKAMLDTGQGFLLIDCRTPREHQIARIEPAKLLPLQELGGRLEELQNHTHSKIVVYCHHGRRSLHAAMVLRQQGFSDIKSMAGGIDLWAMDVDPALTRY